MKKVLILGLSAALMSVSFIGASHAADDLNLCTAGTDGFYHAAGKELQKDLKGSLKINLLDSPGSEANLKRLEGIEVTNDKGEKLPACNAAIVQGDAIPYYKKTYRGNNLNVERVSSLFTEVFQLVCNTESGIKKIKDLYGTDKKIAIGKPGSGTAITWASFVGAEDRYRTIGLEPIGGTFAINRVKSGELACMAFESGIGVGTIKTLDEQNTGNLQLVALNDGDLVKPVDERGRPMYRWSKIGNKVYPSLYNGWGSLDTVGQDAVLVVNADWANNNESAYKALSAAASRRANQWGAGK